MSNVDIHLYDFQYKCHVPLLQSKHTKPDIGVEEIKSMTNTEERDTAAATQSKVKEPHVAEENANAGELKDESPAVATEQETRLATAKLNLNSPLCPSIQSLTLVWKRSKEMTITEVKETAAAIQSKCEEPHVGKVDARVVGLPEESPVPATKLSKVKEPHIAKENANVGEWKDENPAVATGEVAASPPNFCHLGKTVKTKGPERKRSNFQMGLVGFLKFAFKCFDLLAWPLSGLGCPLYGSIRAIENNSNSEMRNVVAYWILFSVVSLFELAFVKLIDWLPVWSYIKLLAMCLLVLPDFNGASYVYECLLRPCLSVDPRAAVKYFIKPKEDKNLDAESFLAAVDRYVQENGSEALEKFLDLKSKHTKPDIGMEVMKAMTYTEEKEIVAAIQSKYEEPNVGKVDARAVELPEKSAVAATKLSKVSEPHVDKENANAGESKDESPAVATEQVARLPTMRSNLNPPRWQVKRVVPNLGQNEKKTVGAGEIKGETVAAAGGEKKVVEITDSEKVQREWTCALCQVTTTCEEDLNSHLQGREHMDKCEELKASKQVNKNPGSSSSAASPEPKEVLFVDRPNQYKIKNPEDRVQVSWTNGQYIEKKVYYTGGGMDPFKFRCTICDVKLISDIDVASHLGGKRHLSNTQQLVFGSLGEGFY
ncbi:hypothetical protein RHMOL_Rhmol11G0213200 [Rhododendron molle]|uniref:Uncharacterized protein n=1 Tax=Rhododendron molle TaxID=49168 RepID=A0ACC0LUN5_RHOML|nr:hypothetical protein RHMOL_Rhmol11G0213200 [Rhododendron molle]